MEPLPQEWDWKSAIIAILLLVVVALGAYIALPFVTPPSPPPVTTQETGTNAEQNIDIIEAYKNSAFKVVAVVNNPFADQYKDTIPYEPLSTDDSLYVVTKRGVNDSGCGGKYSPDICYLFVESGWSGIAPIRYLGEWAGDGTTAGGSDGFKFIDPHTVQFGASFFAHGGLEIREVWNLDTQTGSSTLISSKETQGE